MSDLKVSVVVPARNAATWLGECLESIGRQHPHEMIVIDGCSTDDTVQIARSFGARVISDEGRGLPAARMLGARNANSDVVALIDADVVLPPGSLAELLVEFETGGFDGLQFGLASESDGPGYWGSALAWHHNHSRVRSWFGVCATLMRRDVLLSVGFDDNFRSGEDIELKIRLEDAGYRLGVSPTTVVRHRFADTFDCARDQWLQDGAGLARTIRKHPARAGWMLALPLLASVRGAGLSLLHAPRYLPYWAGFLLYNYRSMFGEILRPQNQPISVGGNAAWLAAARVAPMLTGFLFWALAALVLPPAQIGLGSAVVSAALLTVQLGMLGVGPATLTLLPREKDGGRRLIATSLLTVGIFSLVVGGALAAVTHSLGSGVGEAWNDPLVTVVFLATALFAASAYQLDHIGVAQERADRTLVRSLVQSLVQLAFLAGAFAVGIRDLLVVIGAVGAGALLSVLVGLRQLGRAHVSPDWRHGLRPRPALRLSETGPPEPRAHARGPRTRLPASAHRRRHLGPGGDGSLVHRVDDGLSGILCAAVRRIHAPDSLGRPTFEAWPRRLRDAGQPPPYPCGRRDPDAGRTLPPRSPGSAVRLRMGAASRTGSGAAAELLHPGLLRAVPRPGPAGRIHGVAVVAAILVVAPAAAVAQQYGLTGVSVLWSAAQAAVALIAVRRLITLTREMPAAATGGVPSAARHEPTGIEKP